jgi:cytochrome d ubiquinol oxidase subunit I
MFSMAVLMAAIVAPMQIVLGDLHGLNTQEHQPMKIAAMEGHFETQRGAPLILFGMPDRDAGETRYAIEIPKLGSLILKHDPDGEVMGLDAFPRDDWPNVPLIFWSFRVMVGLGVLMAAFGVVGAVNYFRGRLFDARWHQFWAMLMAPAGFVAILAGWFVTEVGRQPYVVYGLMRTSEAHSPIGAPGVAFSLLAFFIVYMIVFGAGVFYLLRLMSRNPDAAAEAPLVEGPLRSAGSPPGPAIAGGAQEKSDD